MSLEELHNELVQVKCAMEEAMDHGFENSQGTLTLCTNRLGEITDAVEQKVEEFREACIRG